MSQFVIRNKIENVDDLKFFDEDSYYYNNELSHGNQIVFSVHQSLCWQFTTTLGF